MQAEAFVIEMPLAGDYEASGHEISTRRGIIVHVSDGAASGWGEFVEIPGYSGETVDTALAALTMNPVTHSNPMAVAARRNAELDLEAKRQRTSLAAVLGATGGPVPAGRQFVSAEDSVRIPREDVAESLQRESRVHGVSDQGPN